MYATVIIYPDNINTGTVKTEGDLDGRRVITNIARAGCGEIRGYRMIGIHGDRCGVISSAQVTAPGIELVS